MALVTIARYRQITGDVGTSDGDITIALADAQKVVEGFLRRPLESAARTETVAVDPEGYVYPQAVPVTVPPDGYTSQLDGHALSGGATTWAGWVDTGTTNIVYTGGYTSATVPHTVERAIARTAYDALNSPTDLPAGATSVRLGDAAVVYAQPVGQQLPGDAAAALVGYRRRRI